MVTFKKRHFRGGVGSVGPCWAMPSFHLSDLELVVQVQKIPGIRHTLKDGRTHRTRNCGHFNWDKGKQCHHVSADNLLALSTS